MSRLIPLFVLPLLGGCYIFPTCGGGGGCPEAEPVADGLYVMVETENEAIAEAVLDLQGDSVILEVVDDLGNTWEVEYAVTRRTPEEPLIEPWD